MRFVREYLLLSRNLFRDIQQFIQIYRKLFCHCFTLVYLNALVGIYRDECQLSEATNATHVNVDGANAMYIYSYLK